MTIGDVGTPGGQGHGYRGCGGQEDRDTPIGDMGGLGHGYRGCGGQGYRSGIWGQLEDRGTRL